MKPLGMWWQTVATTGQQDWQGPPWKSLLMHRHERGPAGHGGQSWTAETKCRVSCSQVQS